MSVGEKTVFLPEKGEWTCSCGGEMKPAVVNATYLQGGFSITLLTCTKCGTPLVPEELAVGRMYEVERVLEDK